ncbi:MAG: ATP-binding cassette domain-containing protein [Deltaproteobacteria bacterium]|nr:ATP-binding cassette domain-containing protein [Deltaproteobacteria bacterium]
MLELCGVSVSFGTLVALQPTDLTLEPGQVTALIGPSGCGKSTLLRCVMGLVTPNTGTVALDGAPIGAAGWAAARLRMGYVIQEGGLFPHLTARGNVSLMAEHLGWEADRIADRIDSLRGLVQLPSEALDRHPGALSGGQRQRIALMRALMLDPALLLLDEPLGALDPMIRADLQRELRAIFTDLGKTVLVVTHDLTEAARLGDRIVLLRDGDIVQTGTLPDLRERPATPFVTRFVSAWDAP